MRNIIDFVLAQRLLVLIVVALLTGIGIYSFKRLSIDAFPDVTNIQVQIISTAPGMSPVEMEKLVTTPIELQMSGLPRLKETRSLSKFAISLVTLVFEDDVDIYFARQLVLERLIEAKENLPKGVSPMLGPVSTGLGEIYQYTVESESRNLMELRTLQDWVVRKMLKSVSGVTDVNSFGGDVKQYQVIVSPELLLKYKITLRRVFDAIIKNNTNASGSFMNTGGEQYIIRGLGLIKGIEDIGNIVITAHHGAPIYVKDVSEMKLGAAFTQGAIVKNGKDAVAGIVLLIKGGNSRDVVEKVKEKMKEIAKTLPQDVKAVPFYDRAELVERAISTITTALAESAALIIIILFVFLGDVRSALVVTLSLPLTMLFTFIVMSQVGLTANLMSLGGLAIAIGMVVDGAVVIVENTYRHLSERRSDPYIHVIAASTKEVARPVIFGILIICVVFLPLFTLTDVEGKMFTPLAVTVTIALIGSLLISIFVVPVLSSLILRGGGEEDTRLLAFIKKKFIPLLEWALGNKFKVVMTSVVVFFLSLALLPFIGKEFMPSLQEGSLTVQLIRLPGISLPESIEMEKKFHKILLSFPEIESVVSKIGSAEIATDPMGPELSDPIITLKPRSQWKTVKTLEELKDKMREKLEAAMPGVGFNFSQPIALKVDELISGVKSQIAVKIFGDDLNKLKEKADETAKVMSGIKGTKDLRIEQISGQPYMHIDIDRKAIARYGVNVSDIQEIIELALAGGEPTEVSEGDKRFKVQIRFPENKRNNLEAIENLLIPLPDGGGVPLKQMATFSLLEGPNQISREDGQRRIVIECNVGGRDIGGFVKEAQEKIASQVKLPVGYTIQWGGQFENQERAMNRLLIIVPVTLLLIFLLLYIAFASIKNALLIILNVPFALVGGIVALFITGQYLSVPASVGFIALFGVAVLNGIVLVSYFNQLRREGVPLDDTIRKGTELRLRPVLMTASVTMLGLVPLLFATGAGSEIQRPLAIVVVGGLITSTLLTLIVLPTLYRWFEEEKIEF
jgi:cobalt-zinc-cadmium resistance protein CzcA